MPNFIDIGSKVIAFAVLVAGVAWGILKFVRRDEHFPRIAFEVTARFVGEHGGQTLVEVLALLENKGVVPVRITDLAFKLRGVRADDALQGGDESIRGQTRIPHLLREGTFIPKHWKYTFIYPGVLTEYNYITTLDSDVLFVRVEAAFSYDREGSSHHAAKLLRVESTHRGGPDQLPNRPLQLPGAAGQQ